MRSLSAGYKIYSNLIKNTIILTNTRHQLYITQLNSYGRTVITANPGSVSTLLGIKGKQARSKFKKRDKNIIKYLNFCLRFILTKTIIKGSEGILVVRRLPKNQATYSLIVSQLLAVVGLKIRLICNEPKIRFTLTKLRSYSSIKRRTRKMVTKSLSNLNISTLSEEAKYDDLSCQILRQRYGIS